MRFGVNARAVEGFAAHVRRADALGYDVIAAPDHLGAPDPFVLLTAAAQLSPRLRLRTYVLNAAFHNAALLARSVQTLDELSGGRLELGLGAGNARHEFADAGLRFPPHAERVAAMEALAVAVRERHPVPLLIGAMSERGLDVAARHADIVAFSGLRGVHGAFTLAGPAEMDAAVADVRAAAGGRAYESDVLLQAVTVDGDPRTQAAAWAGGELDVDAVLASPFALFAPSPEAGLAELRRRAERWGIGGWTTHAPNLEALGAIIAAQ